MSTLKRSDIFISYGRKESKVFATKLHDTFVGKGLEVWFDQNDIPLGIDFQDQIDEGIIKADNFIFIITPHSLKSEYCRRELVLALKYKKRIIPILHVEPKEKEVWDKMLPEISKINWVYMREQEDDTQPLENWKEIDDFENTFDGLWNLLQSNKEYIQKHTDILLNAILWGRNNKQNIFLSEGVERLKAEEWLKTRFDKELPPCTPSSLHCEFICEARKNVENLMCDVFIAYAVKNREKRDIIRAKLIRNAITVWQHDYDIRKGENFTTAIEKGIEEADNFIYLITKEAVVSEYCQKELTHAVAMNKRIIPLLIEDIPKGDMPMEIRQLQYIHFIDSSKNAKKKAFTELLQQLANDKNYYRSHKVLLSKGLKWDRQNKNAGMLLRGGALEQAQAWLKLGEQKQHKPVGVQIRFIEESAAKIGQIHTEVFVSYSRKNSDFVRRLNEELQFNGKTTWFDQDSIASASDFQQEIYKGIESSDNFLFIITPSSVHSPYCKGEVEHAAKFNKRIITILQGDTEISDIPSILAAVEWIDFRNKDINAVFGELIRVIDTDREHTQAHNKWLQRALYWQTHNSHRDILLRGSELDIAVKWYKEADEQNKQPALLPLQRSFINESHKAVKRMQLVRKLAISTIVILAVIAIIAAFVANNMRNKAEKAAMRAESDKWIAFSHKEADSDPFQAYKYACRAYEVDSTNNAVLGALGNALFNTGVFYKIIKETESNGLSFTYFAPNNKQFVVAYTDGSIEIFDKTGVSLKTFDAHKSRINSVRYSTDNKIITSSNDNSIKIWDLSGKLIKSIDTEGKVLYAEFNHNDSLIAAALDNGKVNIYTADGEIVLELNAHTNKVTSVRFSPDSKTFLTSSNDKLVKLWSISRKELKTLSQHKSKVFFADFSPDGKRIAFAGADNTVYVYHLEDDNTFEYRKHSREVVHVEFIDNETLISSGYDYTSRIWKLNGTDIEVLKGHKDLINCAAFSSDGRTIVTVSGSLVSLDKSVRMWNLDEKYFTNTYTISSLIKNVVYSADGKQIAAGCEDGKLFILNENLQITNELIVHKGAINDLSFSPSGDMIVTIGADSTVAIIVDNSVSKVIEHKEAVSQIAFFHNSDFAVTTNNGKVFLYKKDGIPIRNFVAHKSIINDLCISPNGKHILTATDDSTTCLWNLNGALEQKFNHNGYVTSCSFAPDGNKILTAGADSLAILWTISGEKIGEYKGTIESSDIIQKAAFVPDSEYIVLLYQYNDATVFDIEGNELFTFKYTRPCSLNDFVFSPDGKYILISSGGLIKDAQLKRWIISAKSMSILVSP